MKKLALVLALLLTPVTARAEVSCIGLADFSTRMIEAGMLFAVEAIDGQGNRVFIVKHPDRGDWALVVVPANHPLYVCMANGGPVIKIMEPKK